MGKAVVVGDEVCADVKSLRQGQEGCVVWTTDTVPADNADPADGAKRTVGTTLDNGTIFRIVRYAPGVTPRVHRSNSIDYAVVIEGSIVLQLDDGAEVTLNAGDVLVQRGTVHNWINRGDVPCVVAFVLIDARPLEFEGRKLDAVG